jgi:hypothetical protein
MTRETRTIIQKNNRNKIEQFHWLTYYRPITLRLAPYINPSKIIIFLIMSQDNELFRRRKHVVQSLLALHTPET